MTHFFYLFNNFRKYQSFLFSLKSPKLENCSKICDFRFSFPFGNSPCTKTPPPCLSLSLKGASCLKNKPHVCPSTHLRAAPHRLPYYSISTIVPEPNSFQDMIEKTNFMCLFKKKLNLNNLLLTFPFFSSQPQLFFNSFFLSSACFCSTKISSLNRFGNLSARKFLQLLSPRKLNSNTPSIIRLLINYRRVFWHLSKGKLTLWVMLSTLPGFFMINQGVCELSLIASLCAGTFLCSAAANTFNQIQEKNLDKLMLRTRLRPLPNKKISVNNATLYGGFCTLMGLSILALGTNFLTAFLAAFNIFLYSVVYTSLKVRTPYNTHVGALVGSIPVLMGCTAAECDIMSNISAWFLFLIQTMWQFPHFYGLAWMHKKDYENANYKMFPLLDTQNGLYTAQLIKPYLHIINAIPLICAIIGNTSYMFVVDSFLPNLYIFYKFKKFEQNPTKQNMRLFFIHSLWQLLVLLSLMVYHTIPVGDYNGSPPSSPSCFSSGIDILPSKEESFNKNNYQEREDLIVCNDKTCNESVSTRNSEGQSPKCSFSADENAQIQRNKKHIDNEEQAVRKNEILFPTDENNKTNFPEFQNLFLQKIKLNLINMCPHTFVGGFNNMCPFDLFTNVTFGRNITEKK